MPFKSEKQRRYMYAKHPKIAAKWAAEGKGNVAGFKGLPAKTTKKVVAKTTTRGGSAAKKVVGTAAKGAVAKKLAAKVGGKPSGGRKYTPVKRGK